MDSNQLDKQTIINYLHLIEQFKKKDKTMLDYSERMETLSQQNVDFYTRIKNGDTNDALSEALSASTEEYNSIKSEKEEYLKNKFKIFMEKCPKSIINMIMEDAVNFELLEHVLTQVQLVNEGSISYNDGLNNGLDFIRKISNLPDDFFIKQ